MFSFTNKVNSDTCTIAHRGASEYAYENTIEAFQKAIDMKADAIELDVRKTKDDILVVHHDVSLKNCRQSISEMTYDSITEFNNLAEYSVPLLEEVLRLCKNKISLDIELKEQGYEKAVVKLALTTHAKEHLLFTSFEKETLQAIYEIDSSLQTGYLFQKLIKMNSLPDNADYLLPHCSLRKIGYIKKLFKIGKPIIVWTVDNPKVKEKLRQQNIFGIITNNPLS